MERPQDYNATAAKLIPVHSRTNFKGLINKYQQPQYLPGSAKVRLVSRLLFVAGITFISLWKHWRIAKQPFFVGSYDNEEIYSRLITTSSLDTASFDRRLDQQTETASVDEEKSLSLLTDTTTNSVDRLPAGETNEETGTLIHVLQYEPVTKVTNELDMLVQLNDTKGETLASSKNDVQNYGLTNDGPNILDNQLSKRSLNHGEERSMNEEIPEHSWGKYRRTEGIVNKLEETIQEYNRHYTKTKDTLHHSNAGEESISSSKRQIKNVMLLYGDDWSFNMLGAMGNSFIQTPALDKLAKDGILFTHNCVVASVCMQSRATLYTGQYSSRHQTYKSWSNITMYEPHRWRQTLYPQMMRNGFYVGFFGKYHHSKKNILNEIPTFHEFITTRYGHYETRHNITKHVTQWAEDDAIDFLTQRPPEAPFFLTVSFFATHSEDTGGEQYRPMKSSMELYVNVSVPHPKTYSKEHWDHMPYFFTPSNVGRLRYKQRYRTKEMYQHYMKNTLRMATEVDTACGRIINELKKQGVYDETLIIFTTDNGNFHGQHGLAEKWYAYEESIRVPLIIKDPRMTEDQIGTKNEEFTLNIDLAPTILSSVGIKPPSAMQGSDIASLYVNVSAKTEVEWRKEFLYEFQDANSHIVDSIALINKDLKYIYWSTMNYTQLFDLVNDPYEEYDIFNTTDLSLLREAWDRLSYLKLKAGAEKI